MKPVRIVAKDPDIDITIPMGSQPSKPVAGLGGWEEVELQDDIAVSDWSGQPLLREDVVLLLDAYPHGSVQREWNTVKKLGRDPNGEETVPPVFRMYGPGLDYSGKAFVLPADGIEILEGDLEPIKRQSDGDWQRIEFVLHLMEFRRPDTIKVRRERKKKHRERTGVGQAKALPRGHRTKPGDTLAKVAARELGNWQRWPELSKTSGIEDPNRPLPGGVDLLVQSAGRGRQILTDYHRFYLWATRHGYEPHLATGAWLGLLQEYAENQGVSVEAMERLHGSAGGDSGKWRDKWDDGDAY